MSATKFALTVGVVLASLTSAARSEAGFLIDSGYTCESGRAVVSGDWVAYQWAPTEGVQTSVKIWNMATGAYTTISDGWYDWPTAIVGDTLYWSSNIGNQGSLFVRSLSDPAGDALVDNCGGAISGNLQVWANAGEHGGQVFGRYLSGGSAGTEFAISSSTTCNDARVSGSFAVWNQVAWQGNSGTTSAWCRDVDGGEPFELSATGSNPDTDGNIAVWSDSATRSIAGLNLVTGQSYAFPSTTAYCMDPAVSGTTVVWEELTTSPLRSLWGGDLVTGQTFVIDNSPGAVDWLPAISGDLVTWTDAVSHQSQDLYGTLIPEPATPPILALGGLAILRRRE